MLPRSARFQDHFADLTDPRRRKVIYPLINIVAIAICAVIAGADDFVSIAEWGVQKRDWLSKFLDLSNGIPSHDRFNAVFAALKPAEFEKCPVSWITALHELTKGQVVAIDGKTLRHSFDKATGKSAIHMVSAWATANHISLGQVVVDAKSNEGEKTCIANQAPSDRTTCTCGSNTYIANELRSPEARALHVLSTITR
jgi:hypothetical protein